MAPSAASVEKVNAWLAANGLKSTAMTAAGDWVSVQMPVSQANDMFDTQFAVYTNEVSGKSAICTLEYSIPAELSGHIDLVHPTIGYAHQCTRLAHNSDRLPS